jgi:hypothetical protein
MFSGRSETAKAMFGGFGGSIFGVGFGVDCGPQLLREFGPKLGHSALELAQESMELVFLGWFSIRLLLLLLLPTLSLTVSVL